MSALSCVMLGGDGGYKINVYNIGMTCSAESHIIDRRTYGSPIDRVSMMCMGDTERIGSAGGGGYEAHSRVRCK